MPALFIGHGSPMNTLESNRYTQGWRSLGESVPRPRAILSISAHWYIGATAVTTMAHPRTIHDFYGFPQALFDYQYPAPGLPDLFEEIVEAIRPQQVMADSDQWGLDHGTWSVLAHMFPDADVPVVQLSLNSDRPQEYHLALGAALSPLRERGVLILGSGNVVHNLRRVDWKMPGQGYDWAERFDDAVVSAMSDPAGDILSLARHPDYALAVPTPDHYLPLLYLAGLAQAAGETPATLLRGYEYGGLSMTSFGLGLTAQDPLLAPLRRPAGI
ncbi:4,5-DOPA dioxygenase extradiol [Tsuneonella flava]|uniref:4,5-DOPA dioxygenase extradiol n=2 Tax=Tsuneonella flava TaxID=2055955 RepID=A0ABX7KCD4_9SPHN|nr:4,5-DOPA dioxygenase extradiol [Tsuneonella flava]